MAVLTRILLALVVLSVAMATVYAETVVTFNTILTDLGNGIVGLEEREAAAIQDLIQLDADVICLQEISRGPNVQNIVQALAEVGYTSSLSPLHNTTTWTLPDQTGAEQAPCPLSAALLLARVLRKCPIQPGEPISAIIQCVVDNFLDPVLDLGPECLTCIATGGGPEQALSLCMLTRVNINLPGLVMLSKAPMTKQAVVDLHKVRTLFPRYYLQADVQGIGTSFCTHLSSPLTPYVEPLLEQSMGFTSYEEQNLFEVKVLLRAMKRKSPVLLLGDLNTGPKKARKNIAAQFPASYKKLNKRKSRFETILPPQCTFCNDNGWNLVTGNTDNSMIDHVFTRGLNIDCIQSVLDKPDAVYIEELDGNFPLSDHYGVLACISPKQ